MISYKMIFEPSNQYYKQIPIMSSYFCFSIRVCIKGTLDVISSDNVTLYANLYLANNVEYIVDFIPSKDDDENLTFILDKAKLLLKPF